MLSDIFCKDFLSTLKNTGATNEKRPTKIEIIAKKFPHRTFCLNKSLALMDYKVCGEECDHLILQSLLSRQSYAMAIAMADYAVLCLFH